MQRRAATSFPFRFEEVENLWIPMPDGARLAARLWLPKRAQLQPVPVLIEYIPYRKRDGTRERDEAMHRYFAGHGYAAARIDLRGSGDSDGVLLDEYLDQELDDGVAAIAWLARQPWCNGKVGMIGKSWGGFNALQIAARQPRELGAVIAVCAADDRYADDAHYMGGALLNENQMWGSVLFTLQAQPPDPAVVGDSWRAMWLDRLEHNTLPPLIWLKHPTRDDYWRHGSVCEDYGALRCPVYAVGGWADAYSNAIPRLIEHLEAPCKALIGPWGHLYPHEGVPGPAIGFLQEALRWWDHWLRGIDTGIMAEPKYRVWMPRPVPSRDRKTTGRWVAERSWPSVRVREARWCLGKRAAQLALGEAPLPGATIELRSRQDTGIDAGTWCPFGRNDLPGEQSRDDAQSVCFDSEPLAEPLELLGAAEAVLTVVSAEPTGLLAVRLNCVGRDGYVTRISYGLLNLTHRNGHAAAEPLPTGVPVTVRVRLNDAACALEPGSRLRLAVSTSYWPIAWPAATAQPLELVTEQSSLRLPVRPPDPADEALAPFAPPEAADFDPVVDLDEPTSARDVSFDPVAGVTRITSRRDLDDDGKLALSRIESHGLVTGHGITKRLEIRGEDPLSASIGLTQVVRMQRDAWSATVETELYLEADAEAFTLRAELRAVENDAETVFERRWSERVPRSS